MYYITEIKGKIDKNNHKAIISPLVDRKTHKFKTLKDLAYFSRNNYFYVTLQEELKNSARDKTTCENLYKDNNLLWIDLDCDVDLKNLRSKMIENNLLGFAYYTSKFYLEEKKHVRLCIVLEKSLSLDEFNSCKFIAQEIIDLLNLDYIVDSKIYFSHMYLSKVNGNLGEKQLFITNGKPFKPSDKNSLIKTFLKSNGPQKRKLTKTASYRNLLPFISLISAFPEIEEVIPRNNGTVSISFKDIPEKTKQGYYIDLDNPWFIFHPSKEKKLIYASSIFRESFQAYKKFCVNNLEVTDPFKDYLKSDETIYEPYIGNNLLSTDDPLVFVESPTGTGKTTAVAEYIKENPDKSVLFISVNRMQAVATKRSLFKKGINIDCYLKSSLQEYIDEKESGKKIFKSRKIFNSDFIENIKNGIVPSKLICGILSLHHLLKNNELLKKFDIIIIDEVTTLPNSTSKAQKLVIPNLDRYEKSMNAFYLILRNAKKIICMDGFISNPIVNCIEKISGKQSYIIQNKIGTNKRIEIFCSNKLEPKLNLDENKITCIKFFNHLKHDLEEAKFEPGKRVMVIATSELKKSNSIVNYINQTKNDKKLKVFNRDITEENGEEVISLFENFDFYVTTEKIDIIIYSPTITTGIDIPQAKGTNVYQIIEGDHLEPNTNYQMTMRGRQAETYRILIPKVEFKKLKFNDTSLHERILAFTDRHPTNKPLRKWSIIEESIGFECNYSGVLLCYIEVSKSKMNSKPFMEALKILSKTRKGLITALQIDKAAVAFQNDCNELAITLPDQYINFLKHEKCKISIEEDIKQKTYIYKNKEEEYYYSILEKFKTINYTPPNTKSYSTLYRHLNNVVTVQKVLYYLITGDESTPKSIIKTSIILNKLFKKLKVNYLKKKNGYVKYEDLEKVYKFLYSNSSESKFILREFSELRSYDFRILIIKDFLKKFFKVEADIDSSTEKRKIKGYTLIPREKIIDSLEKISKSHRLYLLITDVL